MAKAKSTELTPTNELVDPVQEATSALLEEQAVLDQLNELRDAVNEMRENLIGVSSMIGDHEARLLHLGDSAKPIPTTVFGNINLGALFGQIVAQVVSGFIQQFPHSKENEPSLRTYANSAIMTATIVLEEIIKRKSDSHRTS
mgnify:FL=1